MSWLVSLCVFLFYEFSFASHQPDIRVTREEGISAKALPLSHQPIDKYGGHSMNVFCVRAQPTISSANPRQVVLARIRKQAERSSKEPPSMAFALVPASRFLPRVPTLTSFNERMCSIRLWWLNQPFPP